MANIDPAPSWAPIRQLETTDRNLAGPGGVLNTQPTSIAARLNLLRDNATSLNNTVSGVSSRQDSADSAIASLESQVLDAPGTLSDLDHGTPISVTGEQFPDVLSIDNSRGPVLALNESISELAQRDEWLKNRVSAVRAQEVENLSDIASYLPYSGDEFIYDTTLLKVFEGSPRTGSYPVISAGGNYFASPVDNHIEENFGAKSQRGSIISQSDWGSSNSRQLQGIEFDSRSNSIIMASYKTGSSPEVATLIEYTYSSSGIGVEILRTGEIGIGHAEYFAIDHDGVSRYVWTGASGQPAVKRWPLSAGVTTPNLEIDMSALASGEVLVWSYDQQSLCVRFVRTDNAVDTVHVCQLVDLSEGVFAPIKVFPTSVLDGLWPILPTQMVRTVGSVMTGLSGYMPTQSYRSVAGWIDSESGSVIAQCPMTYSSAASGDEVEGIGFWWNGSKFETVAAVWRPSGEVYLFSLTDSSVKRDYTSPNIALFQETFTPGDVTMASQQNGKSRRYVSPAPIGTTALFVGGENRSTANTFSYNDMFIEQVENNATRQGARVRLWNAMELKWDGPSDTAFPPGLRYYVNSTAPTSFHAVSGGLRVGGQYSAGFTGAYGALHAIGNSVRQVGGQFSSFSASYPALLLQAAVDIACPTGEAIGFGEANVTAGTVTSWYSMGSAALNPSTDNSRTLGTAANRWSVVYSNTGAINTSDAREKTKVSGFSDREIECASALSREIGWFKFLASVDEKGNDARKHVGMTVQRVIEVMESFGMNPFEWGFICHDKIDGFDRYSFREVQLYAFIAKGFERRLRLLETAATKNGTE